MDPATISALISAGGSIGSSLINKSGKEEDQLAQLLASLNPGANLQGLESGFEIPGMKQGLGQQLIGGR